MPQLTIKHSCIADVFTEDDGKEHGQDKTVKLNLDEEDFFDMLDHVNPKNLIKYLDMRGINHREPLQIKLHVSPNVRHPAITAEKIDKIIKYIESQNNKQ